MYPKLHQPTRTGSHRAKRQRANRFTAKLLITLSSIVMTISGWAILSTQALAVPAATARLEPPADPEPHLEPMPTVAAFTDSAPVARSAPPASPLAVQMMQARALTIRQLAPQPIAPVPASQAAAATLIPRTVRARAVTRSSS